MVNSVILEGRVAGEVDMRYTPDGTGVARFDRPCRPYRTRQVTAKQTSSYRSMAQDGRSMRGTYV